MDSTVKLPTFHEVMATTGPISNVHCLQIVECQAMYDVLCGLPEHATIIEVGSDYGRSSSIMAQVGAAKDFLTIHIDPWEEYKERASVWMRNIGELCPWHRFIVFHMTTEQAWPMLWRVAPEGSVDMAFIDGAHDTPTVALDLGIAASRVKQGGYLLCHDYPSGGVTEAVDPYVARGWTKINQAYGLGIWRRD